MKKLRKFELHKLYWKDFQDSDIASLPVRLSENEEEKHKFHQRMSLTNSGNHAFRLTEKKRTCGYLFFQEAPDEREGNAFYYPFAGEELETVIVNKLLFQKFSHLERFNLQVFTPDSESKEEVWRSDFLHMTIWQEETFAVMIMSDDNGNAVIRLEIIADRSIPYSPEIRAYLKKASCLDRAGVYRHEKKLQESGERELPEVLSLARQEVKEYLAGKRTVFQTPYRLSGGTPFQQKVWHELEKIPYGTTKTYLDIAEAICAPEKKARNYARAVGAACGANPLAVIVPCHRVIGGNGDLTGFASGVEVKAHLLQLELFNYSEIKLDN